MEKRYQISVRVAATCRTPHSSDYTVVDDFIGEGNTDGACRMNAESKAGAEWERLYLARWRAERPVGKTGFNSGTSLEYNILKRY